ncbi:hypothetical protein WKI68_05685 [Streptomyces sp. MS1.HAVA.3]|uniref:Uncharacterized protein n=1 Tax=Streptomyces caledonius TaxID=3134107 RepID=A0ABU8TZN8_9ACTN
MTDNSSPLTVETRETFPAELLDVTCRPRSVSLSPRRLASMDGTAGGGPAGPWP